MPGESIEDELGILESRTDVDTPRQEEELALSPENKTTQWRNEIVDSVPSLRRFAAVLVPRRSHDQEELVQDTILRALNSLGTNPPVKNTRAWLMSIMHNLNVNNVRKAVFRNRVKSLLAIAMERVSPPEQENNLELRELRNALMQLPELQREVILLVCVEGLKYQETAGILNVPVGTVMSRLARARQSLREMTNGTHG